MGSASLRRYDTQATLGFVLSVASALPFLCAAYLALGRYNSELGQIVYGSRGRFVLAFMVCVVASMLPAAAACLLGLSSAGQRRNDKPARSWLSFFLGGGILTLDIILLLAFLILRFEIVSGVNP